VKINTYTCNTCDGVLVSEDVDAGTTPMFLACKVRMHCPGRMISAMYRCSQALTPEWQWYRPPTMAGLSPEMQEHVRAGGLVLRLIEAGSVQGGVS
jgi:hypothetical protein